ncbi:MAG: hypothetical protein JWR12_2220 [Mucilaginibacter sp.]|nr:hypothetical protein [Mucilaginibacter sp.]
MKIKDLCVALELFQAAANEHAKATEEGDYISANRNYKKIAAVITFIKAENALDSLLPYLNSKPVGVRIWASTYILPRYEKAGIKGLKEIVKSGGIHSLNAEMTLNEWKKGRLKL